MSLPFYLRNVKANARRASLKSFLVSFAREDVANGSSGGACPGVGKV